MLLFLLLYLLLWDWWLQLASNLVAHSRFFIIFVFRMTGTLACDDMGRVKMLTYGGHCLHFPVLG